MSNDATDGEELTYINGVLDRYRIGLELHAKGELVADDARTLFGEMDAAFNAMMALAARPNGAVAQRFDEDIAGKLAELRDRVRELF